MAVPTAKEKKTSLAKKVAGTIRRYGMLRAGDRVAVGVSGGADSVALLLLLMDLREEFGISLLIAHFNHRLRGRESDEDEAFAQELAAQRGLEFVPGGEDVAARAREQRWNIEDAARRLRYEFFEGLVGSGRADRIAVGHTADDQAETLLARLARGTGPLGLAGIYPVIGHVVRPLIQERRAKLRAELEARGQCWREDETNRDPARLRTRIRQRVVPVLESELQPAIVEHLSELADRFRTEETFWTALLDACSIGSIVREAERVTISICDLLSPPAVSRMLGLSDAGGKGLEAFSRRFVRRLVAEAGPGRGQLTAHHVEQILQLAREGTSGRQLQLPGGVVVKREFDRLVFGCGERAQTGGRAETAGASTTYEYEVTLPDTGAVNIAIHEIGKRLCLKVIDWSSRARDTSISAVILDGELLRPPLLLRNWRPGDAYRPIGHQRVQKVKRLFQEQRIPVRERAGWPILTSGGRVAWAGRLPAAQDFAAGASTRRGLQINEEAL